MKKLAKRIRKVVKKHIKNKNWFCAIFTLNMGIYQLNAIASQPIKPYKPGIPIATIDSKPAEINFKNTPEQQRAVEIIIDTLNKNVDKKSNLT